jgi:DNA-directed RNA polymerase subunit RPC12/RpoP
MKTCTWCDTLNDGAARTCTQCGAPLPVSPNSIDVLTVPTNADVKVAIAAEVKKPAFDPAHPTAPFRCPNCQSTITPIFVKKVSTNGWIVFVALLLMCVPLCWLGLLIKDEGFHCQSCGLKLS